MQCSASCGSKMYTQCKLYASRRWSRFFFVLFFFLWRVIFVNPLYALADNSAARSAVRGSNEKRRNRSTGKGWEGEKQRIRGWTERSDGANGRDDTRRRNKTAEGEGKRRAGERKKNGRCDRGGRGEARYISWDLIAASSPCHRSSCLRLNEAPSVMGSLHPSSLRLLKSTTQRRGKRKPRRSCHIDFKMRMNGSEWSETGRRSAGAAAPLARTVWTLSSS